MTSNGSVLDRIISRKKEEVAAFKKENPADRLKNQALDSPPPRNFLGALKSAPGAAIIAEFKKASPSLGSINQTVDPGQWAQAYESGGACAMSVLTDGPFFGGSLDDLIEARNAVSLPVLRKDFIIDPIQLYQARAARADAVLLIVAALDQGMLESLFSLALDLKMTPLVEVHNQREMDRALPLKPPLLGINNRNLVTLDVSLDTCLALRPQVPKDITVVGESGIKRPEDITRLLAGGMDAFLIGTTLMKAPDPRGMLAAMCRVGRANGQG